MSNVGYIAPSSADQIVSLPYNNLNCLVQAEDIESIFRAGGVLRKVNNLNLYRNALVHRSYCTRKNENFVNGNTLCPPDCMPLQEESNERLEFLGDAVINLVVASYSFERYPDENEGFLTKIRTKLVNGVQLANFCDVIGLAKFVMLSKQIEENNGRENRKILEDCFESFLGAMFLDDFGYDGVETWITNFIESNIDFSDLIQLNHNYKDMLIKHYQHNYNFLPKFLEISSENTVHGKMYTVCVKDKNEKVVATGRGISKKAAENDCAKNAIAVLGRKP